VVVLEVVLTLYVLIPAYVAYFGTYIERIPVSAMPTDIAEIATPVAIQTMDGNTLRGWYVPSQNGVSIIALHGQGANRLGVLLHARLLAAHGYGVLMMDLRSHGESDGQIASEGWTASQDVGAMLTFLQAQPDTERIGGLGLSTGAITLLHAAAEFEVIEAIVADGTGVGDIPDLFDPLTPHPAVAWMLVPQYWLSYEFRELFSGFEKPPALRNQAEQIAPRPVLYIAAANSMWEAELAAKYVAAANGNAEMWVVPDAGHIEGIQIAAGEYERRVIEFFDAALLTKQNPLR
jgi:pimeloyl-ACP methyl ester carboxylesterase